MHYSNFGRPWVDSPSSFSLLTLTLALRHTSALRKTLEPQYISPDKMKIRAETTPKGLPHSLSMAKLWSSVFLYMS